METELLVSLSRLQFAITALYHFLFVPLTVGLSLILAIMETVYVMSGRLIWKDMVRYWGILFGINFAMGVATGITMEFQFGTNWAYYAHYVGDIFGVPLAIEGLMAFFLEASLIGVFFFAWDRISAVQHCLCTWLLALATNASALWILIANAWMQNPVGATFNPVTMRMETTSFFEIFFNPVAQAKFVHTVAAGYVTGSVFVLAVSAYFLIRKKNPEFAKRSLVVASSFGLASALSVVVLGDESGYISTQNQKMKIAAIEALWKTGPAPAPLTLIGLPSLTTRSTEYEIQIPYALGIIATRSFSTPILGIEELVEQNKGYIQEGISAYKALSELKKNPNNSEAQDFLHEHANRLGYALLLKAQGIAPEHATAQQIQDTAWKTVPPKLWVLFWSFRIMVGCGLFFIFLFTFGFIQCSKRNFDHPWFYKIAMLAMPLPWIAGELGWIVAEYGRQPWVIEGILPTALAHSTISVTQIMMSLMGFISFYSALLIVDLYLMIKYIRKGPDRVLGIVASPKEITQAPLRGAP